MADTCYFSIKINFNTLEDACIIFAQPYPENLIDIFDILKNMYSIDDDLHEELVKKVKITDKNIEQSKIVMEEMNPKEEAIKVEVDPIDDQNQNFENTDSIIKISCFAFYNRKCHFCFSEFNSKRELSEHFFEKHEPLTVATPDGKQEYQCKGCGKKLDRYPWAVKHCRVTHEKSFECPECKTTIKQKHNAKRHMEKCSGPGPFYCSKCHNFSKSKLLFEKHILRCGGPQEFINCHICDHKTRNKHNLKRHMTLVHKEEKEIEGTKCVACDFRTLYPHIMKRHMTVQHTDDKEGIKCNDCAREFISASGLKKHQLKVHGNKPFYAENPFLKVHNSCYLFQ